MKDLHDKLKGNLITKRGPGRPATGKALTPAQKQKAYRARQKELEREFLTLKIHKDERTLLIDLVAIAEQKCLEHRELDAVVIRIRDLRKKIERL